MSAVGVFVLFLVGFGRSDDFPIPPNPGTAALSCKVFPKLDNTESVQMWKVSVRAHYADRPEWETKIPWLFYERADALKRCFKWFKQVEHETRRRKASR